MPEVPSVDDPIAKAAIAWMVLLRSGAATARDWSDFEIWRGTNPLHEAACSRIEQVLGVISANAVDTVARKALLKPMARRCAIGGLLGLAGVGLVAHLAIEEDLPGQWLADIKTGTAKRRTLALGHGGNLLLNARSSVNLDQTPNLTELKLIAGEVMLRGVPGSLAVNTAQGRVLARGADFAVRSTERGVRVAVLRGDVLVRLQNGLLRALSAGELAVMDGQSVHALGGLSADAETAWVDGLLQVSNRPLADVVAALRDYRAGVIRIDAAAAALRVSGVFPLDDTDRALVAIAQTMPVRVQVTTPYWVSIQHA